MEIKDLLYFIKVVEHGSFTKAAAHTYLSQPTLSKAIKKLETELKVKLLERSTRSLKLTDAGYIVYKQGQKILNMVEELNILLDEMKSLPTGEIKFGVPPVVGTILFPKIAKKIHEKHPYVSIQLVEEGAKKIEKLVEEGKVDVGVVVLPTDANKFQINPLISSKFMIYMSVDHPLEHHGCIHMEQLADENFIMLAKDFATREVVINTCQKAGFTPKIVYESSQWDLIMELVSQQLGITMLPELLDVLVDKSKIKAVPLHSSPIWKLGVITRKDGYESFAVKALLSILNEEVKHCFKQPVCNA